MNNNKNNKGTKESIFKVKKDIKNNRGDELKDNLPSSFELTFENSGAIINDNEYEVKSEIENYTKKESNIN